MNAWEHGLTLARITKSLLCAVALRTSFKCELGTLSNGKDWEIEKFIIS